MAKTGSLSEHEALRAPIRRPLRPACRALGGSGPRGQVTAAAEPVGVVCVGRNQVAVAESQAQVGIQVYGSVRLLIERALVGPAAETVLSTGHPTPPHWRHRAHQQQLAGSAGEAPDTLRIEATAHLEMTSRLRPQVKRQRALPASMRQWLVEAGAPC